MSAATKRKPFTKRERDRMSDNGIGYRPLNAWGSGELPAPWAEGDVVERIAGSSDERLYGNVGVWDGEQDRRSDRLHVVYAERSEWDTDVDWMSGFRLVETADPDGLALRERMIAAGWALVEEVCPYCQGSGVTATQPATAD